MVTPLVMVMPYKAFVKKATQEGFAVSAIWDPSLASVMPTGPAGFPAYLKEVEGLAEDFILADFTDAEEFAETIEKAAANSGAQQIYHVGQETSMLAAYEIADELGKAVNPPRSIRLLNDKAEMRKLLTAHGLSSVQYAYAQRWQDVESMIGDFRLPAIVKPTDLAGSRGVLKLTDRAQLADWGRLLESYDYTGPVLIEEFLDGPEFSVESISVRGEHHIIGITRKILGPPPSVVEAGHVHPVAESSQTKAIATLTRHLLRVTGYQNGPAHTEVIWTKRGPKIVESQARLGGDRIPQLVEMATGFDIERAIFRALKGEALDPKTRSDVARVHYFSFKPGVLRSVDGLDAVRDLDFVAELSFPFSPGDVIPETVDSKTRHGYVTLSGKDEAETETRLELIKSLVTVVTE
ncbi:ATP-grasp domain-containing protein [Amycolatopsis xylanica]|uniref:ATP-grasp domain-containing protein n=1 Tax=Amycolatopsis xylanica TaxID=589385 RepID=A0A1H3K7R8_9PSEU|nr:ATP-grasp domain-containing protein [Amycolatopsis xylanica]SDY48211.1 ATP-grasp domain-containing protein [Amycolatopsis xylanica]